VPGRVRPVPVDAWFDSACSGAGAPLPHADRMRAAFGDLVDRVEVHTAAAEAMAALGARAATRGHVIAFADASPDVATVAHELAHAAQARRGGAKAGGLAAAGGDAEREADAIAAQVESGVLGRVEVHERIGDVIHRRVDPGLPAGTRVVWNQRIVRISREHPEQGYVVVTGDGVRDVDYDDLDPVDHEIDDKNCYHLVSAFLAVGDLAGLEGLLPVRGSRPRDAGMRAGARRRSLASVTARSIRRPIAPP